MDGHIDYMMEIGQLVVQSIDTNAIRTACCNKLSPLCKREKRRIETEERERERVCVLKLY